MRESLSAEQEAQARQLADRLAAASREDFLRIARALVAAGPSDSFEKGAELLRKMAGLSVSESTTERTTEAVGHDIAARLGRGETFGPAAEWRWGRDARGRTAADVGIDATGTRQQGPGG